MKKERIIVALMILFVNTVYGQSDTASTELDSLWNNFEIAKDDEVLRRLDEARSHSYSKIFFGSNQSNEIASNDSIERYASFNPDTMVARMELLNNQSPFELTYNQYVEAFVNLYVNKKRGVTQRVMGLSPYYFPMFEEALAKYNIPLELKYLPVVESALIPTARSRAGAMGLWQFMYTTGKMYGLKVNSYYDERMDPLKSTDAACRYLSDLYKQYKDWNLVIAAYNCGPGNVNKAIRRAGGERDFWKIRKYLPRETRGYVPAFHAVNYTMNYGQEHGLMVTRPEFELIPMDTVLVCHQLSLEVISKTIEVDNEWLTYFNPTYKLGIIPDAEKNQILYLPINKMGLFMVNEDSLYSLNDKIVEVIQESTAVKQPEVAGNMIIHRVKSGEVMGVIAQRYGVGVSQLKEWNDLWSTRIYPGQKLTIYTTKKVSSIQQTPSTPQKVEVKQLPLDGNYKYYTIQPGDTLWDIANKYDQVTVADLKKWNSNLNFKKLKPGDKIKISKTS